MNDVMEIETLKRNLIRRGFDSEICESEELLEERIAKLVRGKSVGFGSSMTLRSLGILDIIGRYSSEVFPHQPGQHGEAERSALTADLFFTSANAISVAGEIVNIDGTGNRVAATCFGPQKVIYVVGRNKITVDLESAIERAKFAAVKLARHYNKKTPCVNTGKCEDCLSPECICSVTTIHRKKPFGADITVLLINKEAGF